KIAPSDGSVDADDIRDQTFFGVSGARVGTAALGERAAQRGIAEEPAQSGGEPGVIVRGGGDSARADVVAIAAALDDVAEDVDDAADRRANRRDAGGHGFDERERRSFVERGEGGDVDGGVNLGGGMGAGERDAIAEAELGDARLD